MAFATLCLSAFASGTYSARPPSPSWPHDEARYEKGKALFHGGAKPAGTATTPPDTAKVRTRLLALQEKLPARLKNNVNLPDLAGRLKADELSALEYFLEVRFKIK